MQLHRLEVEGFGPFRSRQSVDFDRFADDGIFLIAGRTGAGKSSILDAVCFGLYGGVPRYDGGEKRLRSDHCEPHDLTEVVVEFSTVAGRYRVTRSPEYPRPAKRGGGMTKQPASVRLDRREGDEWIGVAAREREVAYELDEILQLSREQFLQVILLAQNRFSEFLLAGSRDRQALLRRLFGTERFDDIQSRFDERRKRAEQELGARLATVSARIDEAERLVDAEDLWGERVDAAREGSTAAGERETRTGEPESGVGESGAGTGAEAAATTEERLEALRRARSRAEYRAERRAAERDEAEARLTAADAALAERRDERRGQVERDRAREALARLEAAEPLIAEARAELAAARAAEALRGVVSATARARRAEAEAADDRRVAVEAWERRRGDTEDVDGQEHVDGRERAPALDLDGAASPDTLDAWVSQRTRDLGAWQQAHELEQGQQALGDEVHDAEERIAEATRRQEALERERAELPSTVAEITAARDDARRRADRAADLGALRDAAAARRDAVAESDRLAAREAEENRAVDEAAAAFATAQALFAHLRKRRSDGMAGELAAALVDGQACPVCGAVEHPSPAVHADPVSADEVADAEAERDAAARRERDAAARLAATRAERAAAGAKADGRSAEQAERELRAAQAEHAASLAAADEATALDAELATLAARAEVLGRERDEAAAVLARAREDHAVLLRRHGDAAERIAAARGPFSSVSERIAVVSEQVEAARRLVEAISEHRRRSAALAEAQSEQEEALAASDFDDLGAVESALRSPAEQESLAATIDEHAAQRGKEKAILLELELRTLPEEPIDLAPFEHAAGEARARWTASVQAASRAESTAERLADLIEAAASEHARVAQDAAEFEVLRGLSDTIAGRGANTRKMTLETFVLAAELEEIVDAANRRLDDMSVGRYQLRHSDALAARGAASGLGIVVFDAFTGQTRPAQSLSGGETFLSSLALALGLAEVVTARAGGIRLDTLFIDEGFGSLDADTLDVAMRTLDELRQGGRTVGVISHVEAMQEQIPAQLTVRATAEGPSVIETN